MFAEVTYVHIKYKYEATQMHTQTPAEESAVFVLHVHREIQCTYTALRGAEQNYLAANCSVLFGLKKQVLSHCVRMY